MYKDINKLEVLWTTSDDVESRPASGDRSSVILTHIALQPRSVGPRTVVANLAEDLNCCLIDS